MNASFFSIPRPLIWQIYLLSWICGSFFAIYPYPSLLAFGLLLLASKKILKVPHQFVCLFIFIGASSLIQYQLLDIEKESYKTPSWASAEGPFKGNFCGKITQVQGLANRRVRLVLDDFHPEKESENLPLLCSLTREDFDPFFSPMPGQTVCFSGTVKKTRYTLNSGADLVNPVWKIKRHLWQAYSNKKSKVFRIEGEAPFLFSLREKLRKDFLKVLGFEPNKPLSKKAWQSPSVQARAILLALCFGDKRLLSYDTSDNFAAATLAHSLALSGQHLGTVALIAVCAIFLAGHWRPQIFLPFPRLFLTVFFALPLACLYLWIGNAPPSLIRAAGMMSLLAYFIWRGTAFTGLDLIFGAILFFVLMKPLILFDLGLQLSALCVLIIILFAPAIGRLGSALPKLNAPFLDTFFRRSCEIIFISLIIQIFLLPINLLYFSNAGFHFPLNLLWLPVLGIFILPLAFLSLFISLFPGELSLSIASFIAKIAATPCEWLLFFLEKLRTWHLLKDHAFARPHWIYFIIFIILAASLAWLLGNNKNRRISAGSFLICALMLMFIPPTLRLHSTLQSNLKLEVLDVGQGLSILINTGRLRILYDGGGNPLSRFDPGKNVVAPILSDNHQPYIDAVINSHPDMDHLGGLFYLLDCFEIRKLFHNGRGASGPGEEKWEYLKEIHDSHILYAGDVILLGDNGLSLEVLHPPAYTDNKPDPAWSGNHASLVLRLCKDGEGLVLLTGDAEKDTLEYILENGHEITAKIMIAAHHGSDRSLVKDFYRRVNPDLVLVGCAFQNRWGYPGKKLRAYLKEMNIPLMDTGNLGKIRVDFGKNNKMEVSNLKLEGEKNEIFSYF